MRGRLGGVAFVSAGHQRTVRWGWRSAQRCSKSLRRGGGAARLPRIGRGGGVRQSLIGRGGTLGVRGPHPTAPGHVVGTDDWGGKTGRHPEGEEEEVFDRLGRGY